MGIGAYRNWYQVDGDAIGATHYGFDKQVQEWDPTANVVIGREEGSPFYVLSLADPADHGYYYIVTFEVAGVSENNEIYYQQLVGEDYHPSGQFFFLTNEDYAQGDPLPTLTATDTYVACFLTGALVATPGAEVAVEALAIGDLVLTADGAAVPVKWIGRRQVAARFAPADRGPLVIARGALSGVFDGEVRPARDLKLTADHALRLGGVLVQAGALLNGTTVRRMTMAETGERYVLWHIETADHAVIVVDGCPAETFIDTVSRRAFDNHADYTALYGDEPVAMVELDLPRAQSPRQIPPALRAALVASLRTARAA